MEEKVRNILIRQSEVREALNGETAKDDPDDTKLTELRTKMAEIERELREALSDPGDPGSDDDGDPGAEVDAAERERRELRERASFGAYINAVLNGRPVDGAEAEFASACGIEGQGFVPLALFEGDTPSPERETRAVTPSPATGTETVTAATAPYVFQRSALAALGVQFPSVASGEQRYPVLTTAPPAGIVAKDGAAPNRAGAFRLDTRLPKRITGQFEVRVEDLAVFPSMETDLRMGLSGAMSDALDDQGLTGDGSGANMSGLFNQAGDVAVAGSVETFASGIARFAALVDGHYAYSWSDLRAVIGTATFAKYAGTFANSGKGDVSLYDYLASKLGSLRVSNRVPALAGNGQKGIVTRTAAMQPIRVPTWSALELVSDPYTGAGLGKRIITAIMLVGDPHLPYQAAMVSEVNPKLS